MNLSKIIGNILYLIDKRRKKVVFTNLDLVYPNMSKEDKIKLAKKVYENFVYNLFEMIRNRYVSKEELKNRVELIGYEDVKKYFDKPVVFISAHYGNWEMIALILGGVLNIPMTVIIRESSYQFRFLKEFLLKFVNNFRNKFNIKTIDKTGALRGLMKAIKEGRSVGIFVDQNTAKNEGIDVEMFGLKALHTPSAALLAKKFDLPIIPVFIQREGNKYKIIFKEPILEKDIKKSVKLQSKVIEEMIKEKPEEWYWFHRRFKHYYEDKYE